MQTLLLTLVSATLLSDAAKTMDLKERPVSKVIRLLKQMGEDLQKEGDADKDAYEKMSCWCEVNGKAKTEAIAEANRRIEQLEADIERLTANSASLTASIATLNKEIDAAKSALDKASALRATELAEFNAEEKDMITSIRALDGAITTLSKHQSFLQIGTLNVAQLRVAAKKASLDPRQQKVIEAFLQQPAGFKSYSSQSGAIFGILEQMKETFESNMSQSQKDEMAAAKDFAALKAAKTKEINAATAMVDSQTQELAQTDEDNAGAKQNLVDTNEALDADTAFLADLKKRCANADAEYEQRCSDRNKEIQAVSETIGILDSDDSHDLMGKTLGFIQKNTHKSAQNKAAAALERAAAKSGNTQLAALALTVRLDAFVKVQEAIDEMVTALKQEMDDEVKHRDFCLKELSETETQTAVTQDEIADLTAELGDLESELDTLKSELASATNQVKNTKIQMQRASEDREIENKDFQETVADQRAVQEILKKAVARLQQTYGDGLAADAVGGDGKGANELGLDQQEPGAAAPPPPEGFKTYERKDGRGVMGLIEGIIAEAHAMEREALKAEADSQTAYEEFIKDSNHAIKVLNKAITDKTERQAAASQRNTAAKHDRVKALDKGDALVARSKTLHQSCDYVLDNFTARQEARGAEIQALGEAKAILSGA